MSKNKGFALIPILMVVVLLLVGGGAYYYSRYKPVPVTDNDLTPSLEGWKTYKNTQYGFELNYPESVNLSYDSLATDYYPNVKAGTHRINFSTHNQSKLETQMGDIDGNAIGFLSFADSGKLIIQINAMSKPTNFNVYDYVQKNVQILNSQLDFGSRVGYSAQSTKLGGKNAAYLREMTGSAGTPGITQIYVENGANLIIFSTRNYETGEAGPGPNGYNEIGILVVEKILEAIKFF